MRTTSTENNVRDKKRLFVSCVLIALILAVSVVGCALVGVYYDGANTFRTGWKADPAAAKLLQVVPTEGQLAHAQMEYYVFFHFGINTFTGKEWGDGTDDPSLFNPTALDTDQWIEAVAASGATGAILTAKHHDGFCLWPTEQTDYSIKNSPYKNGEGDIVKEFALSCKKYGLKMGIYLSPWDRHEGTYGTGDAYNDFYMRQLEELLEYNQYCEIFEIWMDGAFDETLSVEQKYDFARYCALVNEKLPNAVTAIEGNNGVNDVRWVGNETGFATDNEWSVNYRTVNGTDILRWAQAECDVSIRQGWFYHDDQEPKSVEQLMDIYYGSVGKNSSLLLNIPPNRQGLLDDKDVARLKEFKAEVDKIYRSPIQTVAAVGGAAYPEDGAFALDLALLTDDASSYRFADGEYYVELRADEAHRIRTIELAEDITQSQRVEKYEVWFRVGRRWLRVAEGQAIGYKRLIKIGALAPETDRVRVVIRAARGNPVLRHVGLYE